MLPEAKLFQKCRTGSHASRKFKLLFPEGVMKFGSPLGVMKFDQ